MAAKEDRFSDAGLDYITVVPPKKKVESKQDTQPTKEKSNGRVADKQERK